MALACTDEYYPARPIRTIVWTPDIENSRTERAESPLISALGSILCVFVIPALVGLVGAVLQ